MYALCMWEAHKQIQKKYALRVARIKAFSKCINVNVSNIVAYILHLLSNFKQTKTKLCKCIFTFYVNASRNEL